MDDQLQGLPPTYVEGFHDLHAVRRMKYSRLGDTDLVVSTLGFGGSGLGSCYEQYDWQTARDALLLALRSGVNYIDTAPWYGQGRSERALGQMLEGVPRQAYYLATKVGRYETDLPNMFDFSAKRVHESVRHSLQLLKMPYVDVIQVHDLEFCRRRDTILTETLPAVAAVRRAALARYVGVTGYSLSALLDVVRRSPVRVDTLLSYSRNNLHDTTLRRCLPELRRRRVGVVDAAATNMGLFTPAGPRAWHPANDEVLQAGQWARDLCKSRGVDIARLAVNFVLNQPGGATHLTSMLTPAIVRENLAQIGGRLTELERRTSADITSRFAALAPEKHHWEGKPERRYWDAMGWADECDSGRQCRDAVHDNVSDAC